MVKYSNSATMPAITSPTRKPLTSSHSQDRVFWVESCNDARAAVRSNPVRDRASSSQHQHEYVKEDGECNSENAPW